MIVYQVSEDYIKDSRDNEVKSDKVGDILTFLVNAPKDDFNVFWDLDTSLAVILKRLNKEILRQLYQYRRTSFMTDEPARYTLTYNPSKVFGIRKGHLQALFYHLKQFSNGSQPYTLTEIESYGDKLLDELKTINISPSRLTSPAAFVDDVLSKINPPTHDDIPDDVCQLAWQCSNRAWTEAHKLGWFKEVYDYDIVSAYPSEVAELLDTRHGEWMHTGNAFMPDATYGFYEGRVKIKAQVSPISYVDGKGELFWCNGSWRTWLTQQEVEFIRDYDIGEFKIYDGWCWYKQNSVKPLNIVTHKLFNARKRSPLLNILMKAALVNLYGLTLQTYYDGRFGKYFNPVWGAIIEANTRIKVAKFIYDNDLVNDVILISTDGCLATKKINVENSDKLGTWKLDSISPALSLGSSMVFYSNKKPCHLDYNDAMKLVKKSPKASKWHKSYRRRLVLEDIIQGNYRDVGREVLTEAGFSIPLEYDRDYKELPSCGQDLLDNVYHSKPLKAGKLTKPVLFEEELEEVL